MIPLPRQLHSEQESVFTFTQQSPPSNLQLAWLVSSLQMPLPTILGFEQQSPPSYSHSAILVTLSQNPFPTKGWYPATHVSSKRQPHSKQEFEFAFRTQQSPPSNLQLALLVSSLQNPLPTNAALSQPGTKKETNICVQDQIFNRKFKEIPICIKYEYPPT